MAGPDRGQAGDGPEAAGLRAGPDRALGRDTIRARRPHGRTGRCPGRGHGDCDAGGDAASDDHDVAALSGVHGEKACGVRAASVGVLGAGGKDARRRVGARQRTTVADGRRHPARRRGCRGGGGERKCLRDARAHQGRVAGRGVVGGGRGRPESEAGVLDGGGEESVGFDDLVPPGTIPSTERSKERRRSSWRSSLETGRSATAASLDGDLG